MYDYIFLDLDGPILEGKNRHYQCYKDIIEKYGGNILDIDTYWNMKRSKITRDVILSKSNFQGSYSEFLEEWLKCIEDEKYLKLDTLKPNVITTLNKWKKITHKIVLVTMRQNRDLLLKQLRNLGFYNLFDSIINCSHHKNNTKYETLKNKTIDNAIFIGDTEEDINTAKKFGITSIGIINGLRNENLLDADYLYNEIEDIDFTKLKIK